jgi:phosphoribosylformimino-5-aminoimidazole carboxamide ribotide isomerase
MDGIVVRAVAGRRELYLPLRSRLTRSVEPFDVARALLDATGAKELYVADLDGLMRGEPNAGLLEFAKRLDVEVWLDVGLKTAEEWKAASGVRPIVATETWDRKRGDGVPLQSGSQGDAVPQLSDAILSLDYRDGRLLSKCKMNPADFPTAIILDTAAVGVGGGIRTILQCIKLRQQHPHLDLITGGGIRNVDDLRELEDIGVNGVLIASALHDGVKFA